MPSLGAPTIRWARSESKSVFCLILRVLLIFVVRLFVLSCLPLVTSVARSFRRLNSLSRQQLARGALLVTRIRDLVEQREERHEHCGADAEGNEATEREADDAERK